MITSLAVALLLQVRPAPDELKGWREGSWVKMTLAGSGCGCGAAGTVTRTMTGTENETVVFRVVDAGSGAESTEKIPFEMLVPSASLPELDFKKVRDEAITIGKTRVECEVLAGVNGKDTITKWVAKKGDWCEPVLKLEANFSGTKFAYATTAVAEKKRIGKVDLFCQVTELKISDDKGTGRTRGAWLSKQVPGWLVRMTESGGGGGGSMDLLEFGTKK
jgi:hypothetical protein